MAERPALRLFLRSAPAQYGWGGAKMADNSMGAAEKRTVILRCPTCGESGVAYISQGGDLEAGYPPRIVVDAPPRFRVIRQPEIDVICAACGVSASK
jgi:hypothetical protein